MEDEHLGKEEDGDNDDYNVDVDGDGVVVDFDNDCDDDDGNLNSVNGFSCRLHSAVLNFFEITLTLRIPTANVTKILVRVTLVHG